MGWICRHIKLRSLTRIEKGNEATGMAVNFSIHFEQILCEQTRKVVAPDISNQIFTWWESILDKTFLCSSLSCIVGKNMAMDHSAGKIQSRSMLYWDAENGTEPIIDKQTRNRSREQSILIDRLRDMRELTIQSLSQLVDHLRKFCIPYQDGIQLPGGSARSSISATILMFDIL